jgi:ankyrin repeat protein
LKLEDYYTTFTDFPRQFPFSMADPFHSLLLGKGTDVNAKTDEGVTALMAASMNGHAEVVELLLAKGADVNSKANNGDTALMSASKKGYKEVKELLIRAGAK